MMVLFRHEWKQNIRTLLIWSLAIGIMGMICICLYADMVLGSGGIDHLESLRINQY